MKLLAMVNPYPEAFTAMLEDKAVNGTWGTDFSVKEGSEAMESFTCAIDSEWVPENMEVVAFVYNDQGICQVTKSKLEVPATIE